jgi:tartrate/fumarate subfamily iron-sulfur-dependent hydro-lyase alpha chain
MVIEVEKAFYDKIVEVSEKLYYKALTRLPKDVLDKLKEAYQQEESELGKKIIEVILRNIEIAYTKNLLICQDTGTPVYFVEVGDMELSLQRLFESIKVGVRNATLKYYLRPNMVHPLTRKNTGDNTGLMAPIIHVNINDQLRDRIKIIAMPKGSGSENMSALAMLRPADGINGIKKFILESVASAGGKGCPPYIVGVGIGGSFEIAAYLAKKALIRPLGTFSTDPEVKKLEQELFMLINKIGIGPMGVGGRFTAIAVNIEIAETHISSLPVAVNIQCWRGERAEAIITKDLNVIYLDEG